MRRSSAFFISCLILVGLIVPAALVCLNTSAEFTPPPQSDLPTWNVGDFWVYDTIFSVSFPGRTNKEWTGDLNYSVQADDDTQTGQTCYRLRIQTQNAGPSDPMITGRAFVRVSDLSLVSMNWTEAGIENFIPYSVAHSLYFQNANVYDYYAFPIITSFSEKWWVNTTVKEEITYQKGLSSDDIIRESDLKLKNQQMGWPLVIEDAAINTSAQEIKGREESGSNDYDDRYYSIDLKNYLYRRFKYKFNDTYEWSGEETLIHSNYKPPAANKPPMVTNPSATPPTVPNDDTTTTILRVDVTDDSGLAATDPVMIDLTPIGYSNKTIMNKEPGFGDGYSVTTTVATSTLGGTYRLFVSAKDNQGAVNNSVAITLVVTSANNPPRVTNASADPGSIPNDGLTGSLFSAVVTDPDGDINNVSVDLSPIGKSAQEPMYDDGTHGDELTGDGIYSLMVYADQTIDPDDYVFDLIAFDQTGKVNDTESIQLEVYEWANTKPKIEDAKADPEIVPNNAYNTTLLSAHIIDPDVQAMTVMVNTSQIGGPGDVQMYDDGSSGDLTAGDDIYSVSTTCSVDTVPGKFLLKVSASDGLDTSFSNIKIEVVQAAAVNHPPVIGETTVTPDEAKNDGSEVVRFTAEASDEDVGQNITVIIDLSALGGSTAEEMLDEGNEDLVPGDGIYSCTHIVPLGADPGDYTFTVTVTDDGEPVRVTTGSITLTIVDIPPPENYPPTISYVQLTPNPVTDTNKNLTITAFVADEENDPFFVYADLSSIGGSSQQTLYNDGTNGDLTSGDYIYTFVYQVPDSVDNSFYEISIWVEQDGFEEDREVETIQISFTLPEPDDDDDDDDDDDNGSPTSDNYLAIGIIAVFVFIIIIGIIVLIRKPGGGSGDGDGDEEGDTAMVRARI